MAFDILHERGVDFHVDRFGSDVGNLGARYTYTNHGALTASRLGNLYRQATVGMVFSSTNHSLVNKEMMACGLPVIDLDVESVRAIFPAGSLRLAPPNPDAIADALQQLLADPAERSRLRRAGTDLVKDLCWEASARVVEDAIIRRICSMPSAITK